jgi:murein DD-endopeptidase MepM/ murein hydrolase activator NlpD
MFLIKKCIAKIISFLQQIYARLQGVWKGLLIMRKGSSKRDKPVPKGKPSPFAAWLKGLGGIFPRGYLWLVGSYLLVITLLIVILVSRQGKIPFLELPGQQKWPERLESEQEPGLPAGEAGGSAAGEMPPGFFPAPQGMADDEEDPAHGDLAWGRTMEETAVGDLETGAATGSGNGEGAAAGTEGALAETEDPTAAIEVPADASEQEPEAGTEAETGIEAEAGTEAETEAGGPSLPQAVSPVPKWELCQAFGEYTSEKLPSGGKLHRLARGVSLAAAPGTPVAALWDGRISKIGSAGSAGSRYIIVKHDAGYTTYYGNLREVWVQEGSTVYRGEHLGILPHFPPESASVPAVSGPAFPKKSGEVSLKTVWKGVPGDSGAGFPGLFYEGNPLLYLEIRQEGNFLDPLAFIGIRN